MRYSVELVARYKLVAIATLAAAVILIGPVSGASAAGPLQATSQQSTSAAKAKIVPKVVGKSAYAAKNALKKVGLSYTYSAPKGTFVVLSKNWTVTKQSPKANSKVKAGTKVKLTVVKTSSLSASGSKPTTPAGPALTMSQKQALLAAKSYLADGQGFSYQGLINQLSSAYGNGFPVADATIAVNSLNADWNAQAVIAAKGYMSDGQGFSHASLVEQLSSPYGNDFTAAQAEYATTKVGL